MLRKVFFQQKHHKKEYGVIYTEQLIKKKITSRFQIKYPKNIEINPETGKPKAIKSAKGNMYIPWEKYYKQISFYDTKTKSTIKFGNMREWMKNNIKGGGKNMITLL